VVPVLLCAFGWWWSGTHISRSVYFHQGRSVTCLLWHGHIDLIFARDYQSWSSGWGFSSSTEAAQFWPGAYDRPRYGFGVQHRGRDHYYDTSLVVPFWFLNVVFSAILFVVWRKTGAKVRAAAAFPVEVAAAKAITANAWHTLTAPDTLVAPNTAPTNQIGNTAT